MPILIYLETIKLGLNQCIIGYWQFKFKKMIYEKLQYI